MSPPLCYLPRPVFLKLRKSISSFPTRLNSLLPTKICLPPQTEKINKQFSNSAKIDLVSTILVEGLACIHKIESNQESASSIDILGDSKSARPSSGGFPFSNQLYEKLSVARGFKFSMVNKQQPWYEEEREVPNTV
nr:hypothetical protein Iba_chr09dCG0220 [Ipomoea batatas]